MNHAQSVEFGLLLAGEENHTKGDVRRAARNVLRSSPASEERERHRTVFNNERRALLTCAAVSYRRALLVLALEG